MVNRQHTREYRNGLREALLEDYRTGSLQSGDALPPVRELAKRHGLSLTTTQRVLRGLADEGFLQLRQGVGAFIGHLPEHASYGFVAVFGDELSEVLSLRAACEGFEAEITRRGGASITLTPSSRMPLPIMENVAAGELKIGGSFVFPWKGETSEREQEEIVQSLGSAPSIVLAEDFHRQKLNGVCDTIRFDDQEGARMAVRHLWRRGHRQVAFLALHGENTPDTEFEWSRRREAGFRDAISEFKADAHAYHPSTGPQCLDHGEQELAGLEAARTLTDDLHGGKVKAVVCVNEFALKGLLQAAREAHLPESKWPAVIAFDDNAFDSHLLSVVRLPWEELGRVAAGALWERAFGNNAQRDAPAREILVPMRMIARVSCFENIEAMSVANSAVSHL